MSIRAACIHLAICHVAKLKFLSRSCWFSRCTVYDQRRALVSNPYSLCRLMELSASVTDWKILHFLSPVLPELILPPCNSGDRVVTPKRALRPTGGRLQRAAPEMRTAAGSQQPPGGTGKVPGNRYLRGTTVGTYYSCSRLVGTYASSTSRYLSTYYSCTAVVHRYLPVLAY